MSLWNVNLNVVTCRCILVRDLPWGEPRWLYLHNWCFWVSFYWGLQFFRISHFLIFDLTKHKKVLLRERKRHTARRVASTTYVVLTGYPPRPESPPSQGTPPTRVPPGQGTPRPGYPPWPEYPPSQGTPPAGPGRVPPPRLPHGILGNVAKHYGIWVPPPVDRQIDGQTRVKTLPSRRTTYAGGKYTVLYFSVLLLSDTLDTHTSTDSRTATPTPAPLMIMPKSRAVTRITLQVAALPVRATRRVTARDTPQKQVAPPPVQVRRNRKRIRTTSNNRNNSSNNNRNRRSLSSRSSPRTGARRKKSWSKYIFFFEKFLRHLIPLFLFYFVQRINPVSKLVYIEQKWFDFLMGSLEIECTVKKFAFVRFCL